MENLPAINKREPEEVLQEGRRAAQALMTVVNAKSKPVRIGGETYLEYEDWQMISEFDGRGYTIKTHDAIPVEVDGIKGAKANADLVDKEGRIVGGAEAYCMRDEENWIRKPWFQLASMAQTRAGAKALRNKFSFIAPLAGVKATPAEEMDGVIKPNGEQKAEVTKEGKEEPPHSPPDMEPLTINQVTVRTGETKGKKWELFTVHASDGNVYTTFDKKIAELAKKFKENDTPCWINFDETQKGKNLKEIQEYAEKELEG